MSEWGDLEPPILIPAPDERALLKWYEDDDDTSPVYVPLAAVCGVNTGDVGSEDEWLTVHLPNGTHVNTNHRDTIRRFWAMFTIV